MNWFDFEISPHSPEVKENKEGADTEKTAEQDKNESENELAKDKVSDLFQIQNL